MQQEDILNRNSVSFPAGAIIGDGDRNEVPFTIARATPCEVRCGLFLAQIAPSLQNKKRALHANLRLDLDKLTGRHGIFKYLYC